MHLSTVANKHQPRRQNHLAAVWSYSHSHLMSLSAVFLSKIFAYVRLFDFILAGARAEALDKSMEVWSSQRDDWLFSTAPITMKKSLKHLESCSFGVHLSEEIIHIMWGRFYCWK